MANSIIEYTGDGSTTQYAINFTLGNLKREYVQCRVNNEVDGLGDPAYRTLTWITDGLVEIQGTTPGSGVPIVFTRTMPKDALIHDYSDGAAIEEENLDESNLQNLMSIHEFLDGRLTSPINNDLDLGGNKIINLADGTADTDGATVKQLNDTIAAVASDLSDAEDAADEAEDWANKTDGDVAGSEYSAKAYAVGGTGVTDTAGKGAAKEWATKAEDSTVDGTEYSAKHYAAKTANDAAATAADVVSTNADVVSTNADVVTTGNNVTAAEAAEAKAQQWAEEDEDVEVESGLYSAKHWAAKAAAAAGGEAVNISYDNADSGLSATDVQDALDELDSDVDTAETAIGAIETELGTYGDVVTHNHSEYATAAQGVLADSSIQPGNIPSQILYGLTVSNNSTDATNDLDIAAGAAISDDGTTLITLSSGLTKRLDATFVAGTGNGGRVGSLANGTYHIFAISENTGANPDVIMADSLSPTLPGSYTKKVRILSITRESGAWIVFRQYGKRVNRTPIQSINSSVPTTAALVTLAVPVGIKVMAHFTSHTDTSSNDFALLYSDPDTADIAPDSATGIFTVADMGGDAADRASGMADIFTNTSAQVRWRATHERDTDGAVIGWTDYQLRRS